MKPIISVTPKQDKVWQAWHNPDIRYIGMGGGAGGGKSWVGCQILGVQALMYPGTKSFIAREELTRLMGSTYLTFCKVMKEMQIPQELWKLNGQYHYIEFTNGSRIDLLDCKNIPSDPMFERFGSMEWTNGWIEEAGEVVFRAFDVLKSRVGRHMNTEYGIKPKILLTFNPSEGWLYSMLYAPWKKGVLSKDWCYIPALYMDNPYTAIAYGEQLESMRDEAMKSRLKDGNWDYNSDDSYLFKMDALTDLFSNVVPQTQQDKYIVCDLARFGGDKIVINLWRGLFNYKTIYYTKAGLDVTIEKLKQVAQEEGVPWSHILVDESGLGGGVVDSMRGIKGFVGNASPIIRGNIVQKEQRERENYANLRSQCYFILSEYVADHKIGIFTTDPLVREQIITELRTVKQKNTEGKLAIISKEEMKENLLGSPDFADTLSMRMYFELQQTVPAPLIQPRSKAEIELDQFRKRRTNKSIASQL